MQYNLENFAEELANKLSKTPLERMAEIRESVRREMDEVFAQQIVREIVSRSYSFDARREVLDRIRQVFQPSTWFLFSKQKPHFLFFQAESRHDFSLLLMFGSFPLLLVVVKFAVQLNWRILFYGTACIFNCYCTQELQGRIFYKDQNFENKRLIQYFSRCQVIFVRFLLPVPSLVETFYIWLQMCVCFLNHNFLWRIKILQIMHSPFFPRGNIFFFNGRITFMSQCWFISPCVTGLMLIRYVRQC